MHIHPQESREARAERPEGSESSDVVASNRGSEFPTTPGTLHDDDPSLPGCEAPGRPTTGGRSSGSAQPPSSVPSPNTGGWSPLDSAPRDGRMLWLAVDYGGETGDHSLADAVVAATIGFNNFDNNGQDEWQFAGWCWCHDHFTEGSGRVLAWRPLEIGDDLDLDAIADDLHALAAKALPQVSK